MPPPKNTKGKPGAGPEQATAPAQPTPLAPASVSPVVTGNDLWMSVVQRTVTASGGGGETVTIRLRIERGWVLMSIDPSFIGRAFLDVEKLDAVIRILHLAREDLQRNLAARKRRP